MPSRDDTRPAKLADSSHDYPGDAVDPPLEEAQAALVLAREVVEAMLARLPAEIRV